MAEKSVIFISCGIFREELEYLVREKGLDWNILFLDAALHVNFDRLKENLVDALEKQAGKGVDLKVVYGHCHPEISEILKRYGAKRLAAGNCLEAMVGPDEVFRLNAEATSFFLSAGWVNNWEKMFEVGKEDFDFDFKLMFEHYKRIIVFDTGIIPIDEEKVAKFSEFTGLPVERRHITLDHLQRLISSI
ncbi:MAG TPA: DUF1638 domain-containing protein [Thermodesulfovibrionales bacterium]|nr:DUF1638 domain-containing protein [Thermodesulfovibrionales bacterium]